MVLMQGSYIKEISKVVSRFFMIHEQFENLMKNKSKIASIHNSYSSLKIKRHVCQPIVMSEQIDVA